MLNRLETEFAKAEQPSATSRPNPLTALKSRSKEEIGWACDLDSAVTRALSIARIKERSPCTRAKPHQKHNAAQLNPKLKTQVYDEKHIFLPLFSAAKNRAARAL